jgi:uncharacterized membrane protein YebE (DUF533 family)
MKKTTRLTAVAALTAFLGTAIAAPMTAHASEEGKRNTAYGLGAAALLLSGQRNKLPAILAGAGAAYSAYDMHRDIKKRNDREKRAAYRNGYSKGKKVASTTKYRRSTKRR